MRKFTVVILIVITLFFSSSCQQVGSTISKDTDHQKAQELIETVLKAIQDEDHQKLKSLFAQTTLNQLQSFDESVDELFYYFQGSVESFDDGAGPFVSTTQEDNLVFQLMESSFVVKTDVCEYRFAMQYITKGHPENIGITSLYVIRTTDDKNLDYMYWGDGNFTPGIHIAISNVI